MRIAAGFEAPSSGQALMWDKPIAGPAPSRGMVFQDYGLFPWLSVRDNIGFGPKSRAAPRRRSARPRAATSTWSGSVASPTPIRTSSPAA
nr:hypothetical protein [Methylorubrum aminovorans]